MTTELKTQTKKPLDDEFSAQFENLINSKNYKTILQSIGENSIKVSKKNIEHALDKIPDVKHDVTSFVEIINEIEKKYIIPGDIYIKFFRKKFNSLIWMTTKLLFPLTNDFKESLYEIAKSEKIFDCYNRFGCIRMYEYNGAITCDDERKILFHIYLIMNYGSFRIQSFIYREKYLIDSECLKYLVLNNQEDTKFFCLVNIPKIKLTATKINCSKLDEQLIEKKSVDEMDEFISQKNYKITENTIIISCQKNLDLDKIKHLINYKINFTENGINEILKSLLQSPKIVKLISFLNGYYDFTQENYYVMSQSAYYYKIFNDDLKNLKFDDKITELFLPKISNCNAKIHYFVENVFKNRVTFLNNISSFASKNEENKNNILALYCAHGDEKEIIKFVENYNCKMTTKSLLFLHKNKDGFRKKIMSLFVKDKVKPDFDVLIEYIKTFSKRKESDFLFDLLGMKN